jgi:diguanylate cyclase (GGDEF)-like protein
VPSSEEEAAPTNPRLLIIGKLLNSAMLTRIGADRVVDGVRFVSGGQGDSVALIDPTGATIGRVTWSPRQMGSRVHGSTNVNVAVMLAVLVVTMGAMLLVAIRGVREVERRESDAVYSASHDRLTGLPNRATLMSELQATIDAEDGPPQRTAVLYIDLDGFKAVNDNYGHNTGDRILKEVADRFARRCKDARLGRLAGDEFAVLVHGEDARERAIEIGSDLNRLISEPFLTDGRVVLRGASVGISVSEPETRSAEELLRQADVAMYAAKQARSSSVNVYDPASDREMRDRAWLAQQLREAIREQRLEIMYQPIFNAQSGKPVAVEALVRWTPAGIGPVSPSLFVSIAEEEGLIDDLGLWILRRACEDARHWASLQIAVNVSPAQLRNPRFEAEVGRVLVETGLQANRLVAEVTETYLIEQPARAHDAIEWLRRLGIAVALDDFGTGYSSIAYLRRFHFDKLKLDRSLLAGIETDSDTQRLLQATVALADALGLRVTAEGVESEAAAVILRTMGCDELQGFHLCKPCSAEAISALVRRLFPADAGAEVQLSA